MTAHPLVVELFRMLPPANSVWPCEQRGRWFEAMAGVLNLVYPSPATRIEIEFPSVHVVRTTLKPEDLAELGPGRIEPRPPIASDISDVPAAELPAAAPAEEPDAGATEPRVEVPTSGRTPASMSPRPAGIPTTFTMIQIVLSDKPGLTARELVQEMASRWWPELELKRVGPEISTWLTKGRLARDTDGKLTLTDQGRNVPSIDFRKTPAPEPPERLPDSIREMIDPTVRKVVEKSDRIVIDPKSPPRLTKQISTAAERFLELRARTQVTGSTSTQIIKDEPVPAPKPTPPQPPKVVAPPPGATYPFGYGSKTIMLSLKEHRILSKLKAAMGKGMLEGSLLVGVAFAGEAAKIANSESYLRQTMDDLAPRLDVLGLEMVAVPTMPGSTRISGYVLREK